MGGGLCGAEKGQPGLSVGTLPSRCPCEIRWREQGLGHTWAWLHPHLPPSTLLFRFLLGILDFSGPGESAVVPEPDSGEHGWGTGAGVDGDPSHD